MLQNLMCNDMLMTVLHVLAVNLTAFGLQCRADRPCVPLIFSHKPVVLSSSGLHALRVREERKFTVKKVSEQLAISFD